MIELQNVSFSYPEQENGSLHNINLTISDGEWKKRLRENNSHPFNQWSHS